MNYITFRKVVRDIKQDFDGLQWALSGDIAYSMLVDDEPSVDHIEMILQLNQYGKASMRLEQDPATNLNENGRKTFSLRAEYRDIPVNIVTTSIDKHLDVLDKTRQVDIGQDRYNIVPPEYLAAVFADHDDSEQRLSRLKAIDDFDKQYFKRCIKALGLPQQEASQ